VDKEVLITTNGQAEHFSETFNPFAVLGLGQYGGTNRTGFSGSSCSTQKGADLPCVQQRFYNPHHHPWKQNSEFSGTGYSIGPDE
jgi:hypothetical protein